MITSLSRSPWSTGSWSLLLAVLALAWTFQAITGMPPGRPPPSEQGPSGTIAGTIISCDGTPAPNWSIRIQGSSRELGGITDAHGRFLIPNVPAGTHTITVSLSGYTSMVMPVTVVTGQTADLDRLSPGCDQVRLSDGPGVAGGTGGAPPVETVLLLDANPGKTPCLKDELFVDSPHTVAVFPFEPNLAPAGSCDSEVAAFAEARAVSYWRAPSVWTAARGDILSSARSPPIQVPLNVWIAAPLSDVGWVTALAQSHYLNAVDLFEQNRVGVTFSFHPKEASNRIGLISHNCYTLQDHLDAATGPVDWYVSGELNVYYVLQAHLGDGSDPADTPFGISCGDAAPNVVFISYKQVLPSTLAHELGHEFGLRGGRGHVGKTFQTTFGSPYCPDNSYDMEPGGPYCQPACLPEWGRPDARPDIPGCQMFPPENIMFDTVWARTEFTIGQAYQMNLLASSRLNTNQHRLGPTWADCGSKPSDNHPCPYLWIDP